MGERDQSTNGKLSAATDVEEASKVETSLQMPESWLKMIQDSIAECLDQRVEEAVRTTVSEATQGLFQDHRISECLDQRVEEAVRTAVSEATQGLFQDHRISECIDQRVEKAVRTAVSEATQGLFQDRICERIDQQVKQAVQTTVSEAKRDPLLESRQYKPVQCQDPAVSDEVDKPGTSMFASSMARLVKKGSKLLHVPTTPKHMQTLSHSQKECGIMQLVSASVPGITAENSPWPTRPSAIRESMSRPKFVGSQQPQQSCNSPQESPSLVSPPLVGRTFQRAHPFLDDSAEECIWYRKNADLI